MKTLHSIVKYSATLASTTASQTLDIRVPYHNVTTLLVYLLGWPFLLMLMALARPKSASFRIPCK